MTQLQTERLILSPPTELDVPQITAACQDPLVAQYTTIPSPYTTEHAEQFVRDLVPSGWESNSEATWALRLRSAPSELVGMVCVRVPTPDVGYWLVSRHRGNGYMTEALTGAIAWAIDTDFVGGRTIRWSCLAGNTASAAVARRAGFAYLGEGPSPVTMRDGSRPASWLGEYTGSVVPTQWPSATF